MHSGTSIFRCFKRCINRSIALRVFFPQDLHIFILIKGLKLIDHADIVILIREIKILVIQVFCDYG